MHVVLDIDDTITHAPEFFRLMTRALSDARVTVITFRPDREDAASELDRIGIRYEELITSNDARYPMAPGEPLARWKARTVMELGADVFFEDMPEVIRLIKPPTSVFMACDRVMRDWISKSLKPST